MVYWAHESADYNLDDASYPKVTGLTSKVSEWIVGACANVPECVGLTV